MGESLILLIIGVIVILLPSRLINNFLLKGNIAIWGENFPTRGLFEKSMKWKTFGMPHYVAVIKIMGLMCILMSLLSFLDKQ